MEKLAHYNIPNYVSVYEMNIVFMSADLNAVFHTLPVENYI